MSSKSIVKFCIICGICIAFVILNVTVIRTINLNYLFQMLSHNALSWSVSQDYDLDNWTCSQNNTLTQAAKFQQLLSKDSRWSACYANVYHFKLYLADLNVPHQRKKLFFDVGANKGYTIATWLSTWKPKMGFNPKNLYDYLSQVLKIDDCGACLDCKETTQTNLQRNNYLDTTVEIYAFEPMKSTYDVLLQVRTQFNISNLYIYQLAISNATGIAAVAKCPVGAESCGLTSIGHVPSKEAVFQIQTMTLDDFVEQKKIKQKIDLLKIDTEGADPLVLQGADKLLSQEKIRMLIFENHGIGAWKTTSLLTVIKSLSNKGFICYMLGKTGIARLTDCWSSVYDVKYWSNVLCVHRREKRLRDLVDLLLITKM